MFAAMADAPSTSVVVAKLADLPPGTSKKFYLSIDGREEECFAVNHRGELHAYVNRCCHVPMSLDWVDNRFFSEDKKYLVCATHGACYLPDTGECVTGPPLGKMLSRVELTIEHGEIVARA